MLERQPWTAGARLEAGITTAAMNEADKSAWCREHRVYPAELDKWRAARVKVVVASVMQPTAEYL